MAQSYPQLTDEFTDWIHRQPMYFVATAPLQADGHVNVSPKGLDSLRVLSPTEVAYLDLTGSGNETSAHLAENGRITLMWCAVAGPPRILRVYGRGEVALPDTDRWDELIPHFTRLPGARQLIVVHAERVVTSCGFGVPLLSYEGDRDTLTRWAEKKGPAGIQEYQQQKNRQSIDGMAAPLAREEVRKGSY